MYKKPLLDTNSIVYLIGLRDLNKAITVAAILDQNEFYVPLEVVSEAVYVLEKVIGMDRQTITEKLKDFIYLQEDFVPEPNVVRYALNVFSKSKLDFVDCLLDGYAKVKGNQIFTFDRDLKEQLGEKVFNAIF